MEVYASTDAEGYARFSNLATGVFFVAPDHDGGIADAAELHVTPDGPANSAPIPPAMCSRNGKM